MPIEKNGFLTGTSVRLWATRTSKKLYEQVKQAHKSKLKDINVVPSEGITPWSYNAGKTVHNPV